MGNQRVVRVFISSPKDVLPERAIAMRVVRGLAREFAYHFRVEAVLWEREPMRASHHFQDQIIPPRQTDIVVVLLWSQLGMLLPAEKYTGALSGGPVTGTEWEFEDALAGYREDRQPRRPDLLLYRKRAAVTVKLGDRTTYEERQHQVELVEDFMRRWFRDAGGKSATAASRSFTNDVELKEMLENHLRELLRKQLGGGEAATPIFWHKGSPYRGLEVFEPEHEQIFFGRTRARSEVREVLVRQIERGSAFVLVMGASGSGKSSLVRAGLLPELSEAGMVGRVALVRHVITRPGAAGDPVIGLAAALLSETALPELTAVPLEYTAERLSSLLAAAPQEATQPIRQGLAAAGQKAGLTDHGEARLLLVVDQLEELFTTKGFTPDSLERYVAALKTLATSGLAWVVATMRSDFFDRLEQAPGLVALANGEAKYLLTAPDGAEIGQIIRQPAREAGLRFEIDPKTDKSLDEVIREAASTSGSLPLLEYLLDQLWQRRTKNGELTYEAYADLGELEGAIGRRAKEVVETQPRDVQAALPRLLRELITVRQGPRGAATARRARLGKFPEGSPVRRLIDALLDPKARLLVAGEADEVLADDDAGGEIRDVTIRVAHEALLTHWQRAKDQIADDRADLLQRERLEDQAARWQAVAGDDDRDSLLLGPGLPQREADRLLERLGDELDENIVRFVETSRAKAELKAKTATQSNTKTAPSHSGRTTTSAPVRVFVSSPSDVRAERLIASRVISRLAREFSHHFKVEAVLWEREPMLTSDQFQEVITPRDADIVVVLLWSRLGLPLPDDARWLGPLSGRRVTGTEWEFEDALAGYREARRPEILVYRKRGAPMLRLDDRAAVEEQRGQAAMVEDFMQRWFRDAEGRYSAASRSFVDGAELEAILEENLRQLLRRRLADSGGGDEPETIRWHGGSPYRGLESFEPEHEQIFFGRTRARNEVRELLERQVTRGTAFLLVTGASGSGKSSLVKAGVLPEVCEPGMMGNVALVRHAVTRPREALDAVSGLAVALLSESALPELTAAPLQYTTEGLSRLLAKAPEEAAQPIRQGLMAAGQLAGLTDRSEARLLLVVDQLEELFAIEAITEETRERYVAALSALAKSGVVWVIATMRSDFFDHLQRMPGLAELVGGEATYLVTAPDGAEIGQIIRQPAREAGLRFETDVKTEKNLDEVIREAARDAGSLPLLEYLLEQLWQRRTDEGMLTFQAYADLGGLEGAMGRQAEVVLAAQSPEVQAGLPRLLRALVTVRPGAREAVITRHARIDQFEAGSPPRRLIAALMESHARLLVADGNTIRVANEALLTHWPRARDQITADRSDLQLRSRLEEAAMEWTTAQERDRDSLLLAAGLPLSIAEDLLLRRHEELDRDLVDYIERSRLVNRQKKRFRQWQVLLAISSAPLLLALGAAIGRWYVS